MSFSSPLDSSQSCHSFQSFNNRDYVIKESKSGKRFKMSRGSGSDTSSEDSSCSVGVSQRRLPISTSDWDIFCLNRVGICFDDKYLSSPSEVLDIAYGKTGWLKPLDEQQREYVDALDSSLSFSLAIEELQLIAKQPHSLTENVLIDLKNDLQAIRNYSNGQGPVVHSIAEEFLSDLTNVIRFQMAYYKGGRNRREQGPVTKDLFVSVFDHFARMCRVAVLPGSMWRSEMKIINHEVSSTADRLILPVDYSCETSLGNPESGSVAVVSVFEVEKASVKKEEATLEVNIDKDNSEESDGKTEMIGDKIDPHILGKHGGELLMHIPFYQHKFDSGYLKYFPGIIVIGTEVTFTLLETNGTHLNEVFTKDDVHEKAKIYYSKPKDMMKKEDRRILMETIIRLNNV